MTVRAIAAAKKRSPAQILIRWGLEHGLIEIPKTVHRARMAENAAVFDFSLDPGEMARLDGLRGGGRLSDWSDARTAFHDRPRAPRADVCGSDLNISPKLSQSGSSW